MLTTPYSLKRDYSVDTPVSASDLNRRARVLATQLPGALRGASLSAGVLPLWTPPLDATLGALVADLAARSREALLVTRSGVMLVAGAGAAMIEPSAQSGAPLIYTQTQGLSIPVPPLEEDETLYIHLALRVPNDPLAPGVLDSVIGDAPFLLVSGIEEEPGALLLASLNSTDGLLDKRSFSAPVLLALEMDALRKRLDALSGPITGDEGDPEAITPGQFLALQNRVTALEDADKDLKAQIDKLGLASDIFPAPFDILADEIALNRAGMAEVNPPSIERGQISVIVADAGLGQSDTPNYSPSTNDPLELPFDSVQGVFGP